MFSIEHITVLQFFQLQDEAKAFQYVELQSVMKEKPVFLKRKAKPLGSLTYGEVAKLKRAISKPTFEKLLEAFQMVFGVNRNEYLNAGVVDYFYALNWIRKAILEIVEKEKKLGGNDPDPFLEMAGVKRLSAFGEMATLINLGKQFGKTPEEIENWKYNVVFSILLYEKVHGEVNKSYNEILKRNAKRKN